MNYKCTFNYCILYMSQVITVVGWDIQRWSEWPLAIPFIEAIRDESKKSVDKITDMFTQAQDSMNDISILGSNELSTEELNNISEKYPIIKNIIETLNKQNKTFKKITAAIEKYRKRVTDQLKEYKKTLDSIKRNMKDSRVLQERANDVADIEKTYLQLYHHGLSDVRKQRQALSRKITSFLKISMDKLDMIASIIGFHRASSSSSSGSSSGSSGSSGSFGSSGSSGSSSSSGSSKEPQDNILFDSDDEDIPESEKEDSDDEFKFSMDDVYATIEREILNSEVDALPADMRERFEKIDKIRNILRIKEPQMEKLISEVDALRLEMKTLEGELWNVMSSGKYFDVSDVIDELAKDDESATGSFHTFVSKN